MLETVQHIGVMVKLNVALGLSLLCQHNIENNRTQIW